MDNNNFHFIKYCPNCKRITKHRRFKGNVTRIKKQKCLNCDFCSFGSINDYINLNHEHKEVIKNDFRHADISLGEYLGYLRKKLKKEG